MAANRPAPLGVWFRGDRRGTFVKTASSTGCWGTLIEARPASAVCCGLVLRPLLGRYTQIPKQLPAALEERIGRARAERRLAIEADFDRARRVDGIHLFRLLLF